MITDTDPFSRNQLSPGQFFLRREVDATLPDEHKQVVYKRTREQFGNELLDILQKGKLPTTINIQETVTDWKKTHTTLDPRDLYYWADIGKDRPVDILEWVIRIIPVKEFRQHGMTIEEMITFNAITPEEYNRKSASMCFDFLDEVNVHIHKKEDAVYRQSLYEIIKEWVSRKLDTLIRF